MILLYVILSVVALCSIRPLQHGERWNVDYISKDTTDVVKGICIWMVFIRHISSYMYDIPSLTIMDKWLFNVDAYVKQLLVVPFLFYSGYGVTLAMINKGGSYANQIPTKRILPTLLNYDVAVFFFLLMNVFLGVDLDLSKILLAFTGWESIRNSNWYIFCILICYFISWASYKLHGGVSKRTILTIWSGILLYTVILYFFKGHWWYDTIYAYGAGVVFAYNKERIECTIRNNYKTCLLVAVVGFTLFYNAPNYFSVAADITAVFLCCILVLVTNKVRLQSKVLAWSGNHLFPLYIYQRLPMVVLSTIYGSAFMVQHRYMYVICCIVITLFIASMYRGYNQYYQIAKFALCRRKTV